jgi:hypothetical protein
VSTRIDEVIVEFGPCCFCGETITASEVDPCRVTVSTKTEKWQVWYCHASCFKGLLTHDPKFMGLFDPAKF